MNNKELEASFRKAKALGDDIREMESIDALAAYRQSQMKIRGLKRMRLHNQLIRCAAFLAIPLLLASLILAYSHKTDAPVLPPLENKPHQSVPHCGCLF